MDKKSGVVFSNHAYEQFRKTAVYFGINPSPETMKAIFAKAIPEHNKTPSSNFELFKRDVLYGKTEYYVAYGWRFVISGNKVVTVERVKPHENYRHMEKLNPRSNGRVRRRKYASCY